MKLKKIILPLLAFALLAFQPDKKTIPEIEIGDAAPLTNIKMKDVTSGESFSLAELNGENGLVVIFTSNTCPYVIEWESTYGGIADLGKKLNIGTVLINSNEAFRQKEDEPTAMRVKAEEGNYNMPYVIDEAHQLADAFGAKTTPHIFFFDAEMKLIYKGAIDDRYDRDKADDKKKQKKAEKHWLQEAMRNHTSGKPIKPATTRNLGCSIKRV